MISAEPHERINQLIASDPVDQLTTAVLTIHDHVIKETT